jgi:hypothetical protein
MRAVDVAERRLQPHRNRRNEDGGNAVDAVSYACFLFPFFLSPPLLLYAIPVTNSMRVSRCTCVIDYLRRRSALEPTVGHGRWILLLQREFYFFFFSLSSFFLCLKHLIA